MFSQLTEKKNHCFDKIKLFGNTDFNSLKLHEILWEAKLSKMPIERPADISQGVVISSFRHVLVQACSYSRSAQPPTRPNFDFYLAPPNNIKGKIHMKEGTLQIKEQHKLACLAIYWLIFVSSH